MTWVLTALLVALLLLAVGVVVLCDVTDLLDDRNRRRRNHTHPADCTCPFHRREVFS